MTTRKTSKKNGETSAAEAAGLPLRKTADARNRSLSFLVPLEHHAFIAEHREVNWSEVLRLAIVDAIGKLDGDVSIG